MNLAQVTLEETKSASFRKGHRELQQWDWVDLGVWAQTSSTKCSWRRTGLREGGENITVLALDGAAL